MPAGPHWTAPSLLARRLLAPNPGPMTLQGTNSYVLAAPGSASVVVVDPGPLDEAHLQALAASGVVELVLTTHHHLDHTAGSLRLHELTGAPVRAADPALCHGGAPLDAGEWIAAAGVRIQVLATPGHTGDSLCFRLPDDRVVDSSDDDDGTPGAAGSGDNGGGPGAGSVLTGDTVLGSGSTIIAHPDGVLGDYLASLELLAALGPALVLPGHGPVLPSLAEAATGYLAHRRERLAEVAAALDALGPGATAAELADVVYADVAPGLRAAAERSMAAQLAYLRR
nr:MBL fold metallo-hydrolase [Arthrobacter sp. 35W]